jgi:hypothetical protein
MIQTCMCWGFDHGDGWFEIIWQLSLAIEEELNYSWLRKRLYLFEKNKRKQEGSGTKDDPYRGVVIEKARPDWLARLAWRLFPQGRFDDYRSWPAKLQHLGFKAFV